MFFLFQFGLAANDEFSIVQQQTSTPLDSFLPLLFFILIAICIALGIVFIIRSILHSKTREDKAFNRVVLQILVPKERKSEGQRGEVGQDDRLEHVKEEIGITEAFFAAVAGLKAQTGFMRWLSGRDDHFSFEIVSHNGQISFYVDTPKSKQPFIEEQIHAQYPYAQIDEMTDYNIFGKNSTVVGAYMGSTHKPVFPFKTYKKMDSDPLSPILNALSRMHDNNSSAAVQYVMRSAPKKWRRAGVYIVREVKKGKKFEHIAHRTSFTKFFHKFSEFFGEGVKETLGTNSKPNDPNKPHYQLSAMEEEMLKGIEEKLSKGAVDLTVRLLAASDSEEIAKQNLDSLINAYSQYNLYRYGNSFHALIPKNQSALIRDFIYRSFNESHKLVATTEEATSFWHLPLHSTEAPNVKWLQARKAPPPANLPESGLLLGHVQYRNQDKKIFMKEPDRRRHLYVIGKSGGGKSVFLESLTVQDINNGHGVCVVDPHGDYVEYVLRHIPKHRIDDVVIFNPSDTERPIGLNMLEARTEEQKDFAVQEMIAIFYKLFPPEMIGPMFEHNMRNVMLTLMADVDDTGTIIDIPRMFTDDSYVKKYLRKLKDPVVRSFWEKEMAKTSDFHKSEMLGYLISKVGRFVENEMMRNIMGQQKSGFDFREIMDKKKILLVNLSKGTTGEVNAKLIGLIVVAKLQMAAMARAELAEEDRKDFYLYIDEFQNFITDSISTILSEARKYRLDLIIAHQYLGQLMDDKGKTQVRDAVLGNAGTMASFRIGPDDAEILAKEFAPTFGSYDLLNVPQFTCYIKLLIDNTASKPFNMNTYPPVTGNADLADAIKQLSRLKYGRDKRIVEAEIMERTKLGASEEQAKTSMVEASL